jgi:hypothetical protein
MMVAQQREGHHEAGLDQGLLRPGRPFARPALAHPLVPLLASTRPGEVGAVLRSTSAVRLPFLTAALGPGR